MPNKVIVDYLSENLKKGYSAVKLREKLLASGYPQVEVDEALNYLGVGTQPKRPAAAMPRPVQQPVQKPVVASQQKPIKPKPKPIPEKPKQSKKNAEKKKQQEEERKQKEKQDKEQEKKQKEEQKKKQKELEKKQKEQEKKQKKEQKAKEKKNQGEKKKQAETKKHDKKHKDKHSSKGASKRGKRSISTNMTVFIAAIIVIAEVGAFIGLVSIGIIDTSQAEYCVEDWGCASWRPRTCPPNATQTRMCFDASGCESAQYKPSTIQTCVPIEGGKYIFTEHDFVNAGMEVVDFTHFTRALDINGTPYDAYISVATSRNGSIVRTSVSYGAVVTLIYEENEDVMKGMNINMTDAEEYGVRSSRYEISDLASGTLLIQDREWYIGIEYETGGKTVANSLAGIFEQKILEDGQACLEDWQCGAWSNCTGGTQLRACTDINGCGTDVNRPLEWQNC